MTYCLGWKTETAAFLIADAAVTKTESAYTPFSTFNELQPSSPDRSVEESALKIFRWDNAALSCAGDYALIREFATMFGQRLANGEKPAPAFENTVSSLTTP